MKFSTMISKKSILFVFLIHALFPNNAHSIQINSPSTLSKYSAVIEKISNYLNSENSSVEIYLNDSQKYRDRTNLNNRKKIKICEENSYAGIANTSFSSVLIAMSTEEIPKCFPRKIPKA